MDAACAFVDLLRQPDDQAGLVTFASKASLDQTLTNNFSVLKARLQSFAPSGGTAEPEGMVKRQRRADRQRPRRRLRPAHHDPAD